MIQPPGKGLHEKLKIAVIRRGTVLYRISNPAHPGPLFFNTDQSGRFNSPNGEFGVCYTADTFDAAFAESLGHSVAEKFAPSQEKVIAESDLATLHVYQIKSIKTLHVGELCGDGLPRLNLDNNINTAPKPYLIPQQWALWVYQHPKPLDGLRYHSRHLPVVRCEALFERVAPSLAHHDLGSVLNWVDPKTGCDIWDLLDDHGWSVV